MQCLLSRLKNPYLLWISREGPEAGEHKQSEAGSSGSRRVPGDQGRRPVPVAWLVVTWRLQEKNQFWVCPPEKKMEHWIRPSIKSRTRYQLAGSNVGVLAQRH